MTDRTKEVLVITLLTLIVIGLISCIFAAGYWFGEVRGIREGYEIAGGCK